MLTTRCLSLAAICYLAASAPLRAQPASPESHAAAETTDDHGMHAAAAMVIPAVVRIAYSDTRTGTGVIVTPEGHVAAVSADREASASSRQVTISLPDGRRASATRLGWSSEWRVELLKIEGAGQWPYAEIDPTIVICPGQRCLLVGHPRRELDADTTPLVCVGTVQHSALPYWYIFSDDTAETIEGGLFNADGKFVGLRTRTVSGSASRARQSAHTCSYVFSKYWSRLVAGDNIDRIRLTAADAPEEDDTTDRHQVHAGDYALGTAKAATVKVTVAGESGGSGVVVTSDGYVLTHAHGRLKRPGEPITITFADGKKSPARLVNANPISDIALVKLENDGPWPHAAWGRSLGMRPGDSCVAIGYPRRHSGAEPVVRATRVVEPEDIEWSHLLWTSDYVLEGGESGGGLFDRGGRLVGMIQGYRVRPQPTVAFHSRIELLRSQWQLWRGAIAR